MTTKELKKAFAEAEKELIALSLIVPNSSSVDSYISGVQKSANGILRGLKQRIQSYRDTAVQKMYFDKVESLKKEIGKQFKDAGKNVPEFQDASYRDEIAVNDAKANLDINLSVALSTAENRITEHLNDAREKVNAEVEVYGQRANGAQEIFSQTITEKGIQAKSYYTKNGQGFMGLSSYADIVLSGVPNEIENTACLNFGLNNEYDLVMITEHFNSCPLCLPYQGRVYSLTGADPRFPLLSETPWQMDFQNFHPNCAHVMVTYIDELKDPNEVARMQEYSNRSFDIGGEGWTDAQVKAAKRNLEYYRKDQTKKKAVYYDRQQYNRYKARLGDKVPKTFAAFRSIKVADGKAWERLQTDFRNEGLYRKATNSGAFAQLEIPMQKRFVEKIARQYGISLSKIAVKIVRDAELLDTIFTGSADFASKGTIRLYPNAFKNKETLLRTLIHEKVHIKQFRKYGYKTVADNKEYFEALAYFEEDEIFSKIKL